MACIALPTPAQALHAVAQWQGETTGFAALLTRYGSKAAALHRFGLLEWQARRPDAAVAAFTAALALAPEDPGLWTDLAAAYLETAGRDLAEICVERAIEADANHARAFLLRGNIRRQRGDDVQAETDWRRAIALDAALADAHFALGILRFDQRRYADAAVCFRAAITHGIADAILLTCLAHALYMTGAFGEAASWFEVAARFGALDGNARRTFARARTFQTMIEGRVEEALAAYPALAGAGPEDLAAFLHEAFTVLSAFGHQAAAIAVGQLRLARDPSDSAQRYLLDAVSGEALTEVPPAYVERHFDQFAEAFDHKLVDVLGYHAPAQMGALIARHRQGFAEILDLGCGTGLAAETLAAFGGRLTGVDLSGRMLDAASRRGRYAELVKSEAVTYLATQASRFDLVFAADLLIYFGDLHAIMAAIARAIVPGGIFAFSIERSTSEDFRLLPSGRFAHAPDYIGRLAAMNFATLEWLDTTIRHEANQPVAGALAVLRRRGVAKIGAPPQVPPGPSGESVPTHDVPRPPLMGSKG